MVKFYYLECVGVVAMVPFVAFISCLCCFHRDISLVLHVKKSLLIFSSNRLHMKKQFIIEAPALRVHSAKLKFIHSSKIFHFHHTFIAVRFCSDNFICFQFLFIFAMTILQSRPRKRRYKSYFKPQKVL